MRVGALALFTPDDAARDKHRAAAVRGVVGDVMWCVAPPRTPHKPSPFSRVRGARRAALEAAVDLSGTARSVLRAAEDRLADRSRVRARRSAEALLVGASALPARVAQPPDAAVADGMWLAGGENELASVARGASHQLIIHDDVAAPLWHRDPVGLAVRIDHVHAGTARVCARAWPALLADDLLEDLELRAHLLGTELLLDVLRGLAGGATVPDLGPAAPTVARPPDEWRRAVERDIDDGLLDTLARARREDSRWPGGS